MESIVYAIEVKYNDGNKLEIDDCVSIQEHPFKIVAYHGTSITHINLNDYVYWTRQSKEKEEE